MRRTVATVLFAVLAGTAAPGLVHATTGFGPVQPTCAQRVAADSDGTLYGAGSCGGSEVRYTVRRPGEAWRDTGLGWPDKRVEAVAADETATFVVVSCTSEQPGCAAADPLGKDWYVGKVPHGGRPSALTSLGGTEFGNDGAAIAARGGKWWAVVGSTVKDRDVPGSGSQTLTYRKTFGGAGRGTVPVPVDPRGRTLASQPSIALTGDGAALVFVTQVDTPESEPALQLASAGPDGRFTTSQYGPAAGAPAAAPDVTVSGGRTYVAWARAGRLAVGLGQGASARRVDLPTRGAVGQVSVAASGGRLAVSSAETFAFQGRRTSRVYARLLDGAGAVRSTSELTATSARRDPHVQAGLTDSTAARGRVTVAFGEDIAGTRRSSTATQP